jgi:hypothetical protein
MAGLIEIAAQALADFRGVPCIFEYINDDGGYVRTNCGQAAAATLLTFHGKLRPDAERARQVMAALEREHPPDNVGGLLGTSRRRVARILRAHGVRLRVVEGEEALRRELDRGHPVAVMLGVSGGTFLRFDLPGGHWMVAHGYDRDHVYLTNWGSMTWEEFRRGWAAFVPRLIGMRFRGLVAESAPSPQGTPPAVPSAPATPAP